MVLWSMARGSNLADFNFCLKSRHFSKKFSVFGENFEIVLLLFFKMLR